MLLVYPVHIAELTLYQGIVYDNMCTYYVIFYCYIIISGSTMEQATADVIDVQIPHIGKLMQAGDLVIDSIDVFCEKGVFDVDSTRRILLAGKAINLPANFHGDELHPMNAAEVQLQTEIITVAYIIIKLVYVLN